MNTQTKWIIGIVVVILVIAGIALSNQPSNLSEVGPIKVGVIQSLSGNAAYYGNLNMQGVEVALAEIKDKYPDINLEVFHQDSFYTPKGGVDAYTNLRSQNAIDAVITHASPVALAVKPLAEQDGILQMAVSASASDYSSPDDLSFRASASTDLEATPMAQYIADQGYERLSILYFQNDIGVSIKDSLKSEVARISPQTNVVLEEGFLIESTDFRTLLTKIKSADADSVYIAGLASNIANILNQAQELGLTAGFLGFRASEDPTLLQNAPETSEGFVYTYNFDPQDDNSSVQDFVARFSEQYGSNPDGYAAEGYLGFKFIVESFVECGKDYACIQKYLTNLEDYPSIFGPFTFDDNGDPHYNFFLKTVENGEFVRLKE